MARLTFKCSKEARCPNNPPDHQGTGNGAGEFCLYFQSWFEATENQLVQWHARGIRCGCGAPFAAIVLTEPNLPDAMEVPPLPPLGPTDGDATIATAAAEAEFRGIESADPGGAAAIRQWYGGRMPWEPSGEAPTRPETPEAIRASTPPGAPSSTEPPPPLDLRAHYLTCRSFDGGPCTCGVETSKVPMEG